MFILSPNALFLLRLATAGILGFAVIVSYVKCLGVVQDAAQERNDPAPRDKLDVVLRALQERGGFVSAMVCITAEVVLVVLVFRWWLI